MSRVRHPSTPISDRDAGQRLNRFDRIRRGVQRPIDERCGRNGRHGHGGVDVELHRIDPDR
jgi:hypothetical protein